MLQYAKTSELRLTIISVKLSWHVISQKVRTLNCYTAEYRKPFPSLLSVRIWEYWGWRTTRSIGRYEGSWESNDYKFQRRKSNNLYFYDIHERWYHWQCNLRLLMESNSSPKAYLKRIMFSLLNCHPYVRDTHCLASLPWKLVLPSEIVYIRVSLSTTLPSTRCMISQRTFHDWNEDTHPNKVVLAVVSGHNIQLHWQFRGLLTSLSKWKFREWRT